MVLIMDYLNSGGYLETCEKLQQEASGAIKKFTAADNMDLMYILQVIVEVK